MKEKEYFLMHKEIPVCLMEIDDDGRIGRIRRNQANGLHALRAGYYGAQDPNPQTEGAL